MFHGCGHEFCRSCVGTTGKCPKAGCTSAPQSGPPSEWVSPRPRAMASKAALLVYCPFSSRGEDGAVARGSHGSGGGCAAPPMRFDALDAHAASCEHGPEACKLGCGTVTSKKDAAAHAAACPRRMLDCPYCARSVASAAMPLHAATCPDTPLLCAHAGCGARFRRRETAQHDALASARHAAAATRIMREALGSMDAPKAKASLKTLNGAEPAAVKSIAENLISCCDDPNSVSIIAHAKGAAESIAALKKPRNAASAEAVAPLLTLLSRTLAASTDPAAYDPTSAAKAAADALKTHGKASAPCAAAACGLLAQMAGERDWVVAARASNAIEALFDAATAHPGCAKTQEGAARALKHLVAKEPTAEPRTAQLRARAASLAVSLLDAVPGVDIETLHAATGLLATAAVGLDAPDKGDAAEAAAHRFIAALRHGSVALATEALRGLYALKGAARARAAFLKPSVDGPSLVSAAAVAAHAVPGLLAHAFLLPTYWGAPHCDPSCWAPLACTAVPALKCHPDESDLQEAACACLDTTAVCCAGGSQWLAVCGALSSAVPALVRATQRADANTIASASRLLRNAALGGAGEKAVLLSLGAVPAVADALAKAADSQPAGVKTMEAATWAAWAMAALVDSSSDGPSKERAASATAACKAAFATKNVGPASAEMEALSVALNELGESMGGGGGGGGGSAQAPMEA